MGDKIKIHLKDFLCLFFLLSFWLIPSWIKGLTAKSIINLPRPISCFHMTGGLFTHANPRWPTPYIQILLDEGGEWITLPEADFFLMKTFGYRSRLFEALYLTHHEKQLSERVQKNLAQWVSNKYAKETNVRPKAVRFIAGVYLVEEGKPPSGYWKKVPLNEFEEDAKYVLSTHYF